jgi:hypothetical protein
VLQMLRKYTPILIGAGVLIILLDVVIVFYRGLGLEKGTAIYAAIVTVLAAGTLFFQRHLRRSNASTNCKTTDQDERTS